jgi:hypothetical protein
MAPRFKSAIRAKRIEIVLGEFTMKARWSIAAAVLIATAVRGEGPLINRDCTKTTCPPSRYCCPDDYCSKPLPFACPSVRGCRDDYCPTPFPAILCPPPYCGKDDYCAKWFPNCLPPSLRPWYVCGPAACEVSPKK